MLYYEFEAGEQVYKLRLNTRAVVSLEEKLGKNPLMVFTENNVPKITEMVAILQAALQEYQHGYTAEKTYSVFDAFIEDGNTPTDFINVIVEVYKVSGLLATDESEQEKN